MIELDYQVLAAGLYDEGAMATFVNNLDPEAVGKPAESFGMYQLYRNMVKCYESQGDISAAGFHNYLSEYPEVYESLGGAEGYGELMSRLEKTSRPDPKSLIKSVDRRYKKVQLSKQLNMLNKALFDDDVDETTIAELGHDIKSRSEEVRSQVDFQVRTAADMIDDVEELWEKQSFLPTPFPDLNEALGYDKETGGLLRAGVYAIVARSGLGKSVLSKNIANHLLDNGYSCLYINYEEPEKLWEKILFTQITGTNPFKDVDSSEAAAATERYQAKLAEWGQRLMVQHDPKSLYYEDIENWIRQLYIEHPQKPDLVVIDTLQSMFSKSGGKARWGEYEQMMVRIEKLAKDIDAAFILTAQQNNNALRESRTEINQSDIGGSVTIAQKATATLVIQERKTDMDDEFMQDSADSGVMEVQIPKNRITGTTFANRRPLIQYDDTYKSYYPTTLNEQLKKMKDKVQIFSDSDPMAIAGGLV